MENNKKTMNNANIVSEGHALVKSNLSVLSQLAKQEKEVVKRRMGLQNGKVQSVNEVSKALHISSEQVREIERRAYCKLLNNAK